MDSITLLIKNTTNDAFFRWEDLQEDFTKKCDVAGLLNFRFVIAEFNKLEIKNTVSADYELSNKVIKKNYFFEDGLFVLSKWSEFVHNNTKELLALKNLGWIIDAPNLKTNIEPDNVRCLRLVNNKDSRIVVKQNMIELQTPTHIDYLCKMDWSLYEFYYNLYKFKAILSPIIRLAFTREYITINDIYPNYVSFSYPTGEQGMPDSSINLYIDQVYDVILGMKALSNIFPDDPIRLENRFKDSYSHYFVLLGQSLNKSIDEYIDLQLNYFKGIASDMEFISAKQKWERLI